MARTWWGVALLLLAAFARIWLLNEAPPGLQHDEIFKAQEGRALVEQGDLRLFYPSNQGHEGAYVWVLGLSYALFSNSVLMIKFPPLVFGLLTVALTYRVFGELAGRRVGFIAGGLTAVSFWAIYPSRVGLRAVMLPAVALLVIWGLHRLYSAARARHPASLPATLLTALALGLAIYTYTSAFALYLAFITFGLALLAFDRPTLRRCWRHMALIGMIAALLALPMVAVRLNDPQGQNRVSTITRPLNDFLAGQPGELIDNAWGLAGMFAFTGDPEWRYNVAGRPLFVLPVGLLFYAGFALAAWRVRRQPLLAALLVLLLTGFVPSLLTVSAPSFLRSIVALPPVMLCIALALDALRDKRTVWALGLGVIAVTAAADWPAYFHIWPRHDEVQRIYRDDLQQLATYLNTQDTGTLLLVSTTDTELDPPLFDHYQPSPGAHVAFFDGRTNIALSDSQPALLLISPWSQITPPHADWLTADTGTIALEPLRRQDGEIAFQVYQLDPSGAALGSRLADAQQQPVYIHNETAFPAGRPERWAQPVAYPVNFGGIVALVGVELPRSRIATQFDGVNIQLYLRPLVERADLPLNVFVHLSRRDGHVHAQRDLLGMPPRQWLDGVIFIQDNFVIAGPTPPGAYIVTMGVYNYETGERLPVLNPDGQPIADRLVVGRVQAAEGE